MSPPARASQRRRQNSSSPPHAATYASVTGKDGIRLPLAALDSTEDENIADRAISRYVGFPASVRNWPQLTSELRDGTTGGVDGFLWSAHEGPFPGVGRRDRFDTHSVEASAPIGQPGSVTWCEAPRDPTPGVSPCRRRGACAGEQRTAIAASSRFAYALPSSGTVWTWGGGSFEPVRVAIPLPDNTRITAIAAGTYDTAYALRSDGTVWSWGRNYQGETGTGSTSYTVATPTQVTGLTDVVTIAGGTSNGYAVTADGTVWSWGENIDGQLGTGSGCPSPDLDTCWVGVPVQVSTLTDAVTIDSIYGTTIAIDADGTVWAWGSADVTGDLGNGTSCDRACDQRTPAPIPLTGVSDIAAGGLGHFAIASS